MTGSEKKKSNFVSVVLQELKNRKDALNNFYAKWREKNNNGDIFFFFKVENLRQYNTVAVNGRNYGREKKLE